MTSRSRPRDPGRSTGVNLTAFGRTLGDNPAGSRCPPGTQASGIARAAPGSTPARPRHFQRRTTGEVTHNKPQRAHSCLLRCRGLHLLRRSGSSSAPDSTPARFGELGSTPDRWTRCLPKSRSSQRPGRHPSQHSSPSLRSTRDREGGANGAATQSDPPAIVLANVQEPGSAMEPVEHPRTPRQDADPPTPSTGSCRASGSYAASRCSGAADDLVGPITASPTEEKAAASGLLRCSTQAIHRRVNR